METSHSTVQQNELVAWWRVAAVSSMVSFSLPTFITGIEIQQELSPMDGLVALIIASIVLTLIGATMGTIGVLTRLNSYQLVSIAFGSAGAKIVNLAFAISLLGWFGVNIDVFAIGLNELIQQSYGEELPIWIIECLAAGVMVLTTVYGFKAINLLATLMIPILVVVTFLMFNNASSSMNLMAFFQLEEPSKMAISEGVAAIVGAIIIGTIILPDITRFSRQKRGGIYTAIWAYSIVQFAVLFIAAFASVALSKSEILSLLLALGLGLAAFVIVIAGSWVLNSLNLYSTLLSVDASAPQRIQIMQKKRFAIILGAIGTLAAFFNILDFFVMFLIVLATVFIPVAGIIIVDFLLINRTSYLQQSELQQARFNRAAIIAWVSGAFIASSDLISWLPNITGMASIDGILVAALAYIGLSKVGLVASKPS